MEKEKASGQVGNGKRGKKKRTHLLRPHIAAFYLHFVFIDQHSLQKYILDRSANSYPSLQGVGRGRGGSCPFLPGHSLCIIYGQLKAFTCEQF